MTSLRVFLLLLSGGITVLVFLVLLVSPQPPPPQNLSLPILPSKEKLGLRERGGGEGGGGEGSGVDVIYLEWLHFFSRDNKLKEGANEDSPIYAVCEKKIPFSLFL